MPGVTARPPFGEPGGDRPMMLLPALVMPPREVTNRLFVLAGYSKAPPCVKPPLPPNRPPSLLPPKPGSGNGPLLPRLIPLVLPIVAWPLFRWCWLDNCFPNLPTVLRCTVVNVLFNFNCNVSAFRNAATCFRSIFFSSRFDTWRATRSCNNMSLISAMFCLNILRNVVNDSTKQK